MYQNYEDFTPIYNLLKAKLIEFAETLFMMGYSSTIRRKNYYLPYEWKKGTYFTPRRVILKKMEAWEY